VICYVLDSDNSITLSLIRALFQNENEEIKKHAIYLLGKHHDRRKALDLFVLGLEDPDPMVVHGTLQALQDLKEKSLLKNYRKVALRFVEDEAYIHANLTLRLKEHRFKSIDQFLTKWKP